MHAHDAAKDVPISSLPPDIYRQVYQRLFRLYWPTFAGHAVNRQHIEQMTHDCLNEARSHEQLALFEQMTGVSLRGKRFLEIGAGIGLTISVARRYYEIEAFGIEPGQAEYDGTRAIAGDILTYYGFSSSYIQGGVGEYLPYPDNTFDVVYSTNVLEHVAQPQQVIDEAIRVLKVGGIMQFVVPNYGSLWEGHYGIFWIPNMPLWAAKLYVRLYGRSPAYLETLQFINRPWFEQMLVPHRQHIQIISWGEEIWEARVRQLTFSSWAALDIVKYAMHWIHRLQLVDPLIWLGKRLHWETPLILTLRKTEARS